MSNQDNHMDTSKQIRHIFGCNGETVHVTPGFQLLKSGDITKCPTCGATVSDITNTPLGQSYMAFGRPDLGDRPS